MSLSTIFDAGLRPWIGTSPQLESSLQLSPFGCECRIVSTGKADQNFLNAYLIANGLAFGNPLLKMPNWVLVDCVLNQSAVAGFMAPKAMFSDNAIEAFRTGTPDIQVDVDALDYLPVSGQIAGLTADRETWFGFSLFSLQRLLKDLPKGIWLAPYTKALAIETYQATSFAGIAQYDNRAVQIHGMMGQMFIREPVVWMHPQTTQTFTYEMQVDFNIDQLLDTTPSEPDFYLKADDDEKKFEVELAMKSGHRFEILAPFQVDLDGTKALPIRQHKPIRQDKPIQQGPAPETS